MKAHVIDDGLVVNTIEVSSLDFMPNLIEATTGEIGWTYSNGNLNAPTVSISEEEKKLIIREKRNALLAESDWTQITDATVDKTAWATYRQSLRDITTHSNFPNLEDSDWPTAP